MSRAGRRGGRRAAPPGAKGHPAAHHGPAGAPRGTPARGALRRRRSAQLCGEGEQSGRAPPPLRAHLAGSRRHSHAQAVRTAIPPLVVQFQCINRCRMLQGDTTRGPPAAPGRGGAGQPAEGLEAPRGGRRGAAPGRGPGAAPRGPTRPHAAPRAPREDMAVAVTEARGAAARSSSGRRRGRRARRQGVEQRYGRGQNGGGRTRQKAAGHRVRSCLAAGPPTRRRTGYVLGREAGRGSWGAPAGGGGTLINGGVGGGRPPCSPGRGLVSTCRCGCGSNGSNARAAGHGARRASVRGPGGRGAARGGRRAAPEPEPGPCGRGGAPGTLQPRPCGRCCRPGAPGGGLGTDGAEAGRGLEAQGEAQAGKKGERGREVRIGGNGRGWRR
jgi:hypothetical protein